MRTAGCSVLTVKGSEAGHVDPVQRILVPYDFSPESQWALENAQQLARSHRARIDLLHVAAPPITPGAIAELPLPPASYGELLETTKERLQQVVAGTCADLAVTAHVREGSPAWEISEFAKTTKSDLVVIAGRSLSTLPRMLLGSVSERVMRLGNCPILLLQPPEPTDDNG